MLLNIIEFVKDTGYEMTVAPEGPDTCRITLKDPETGMRTDTTLNEEGLRRATNARYFQSRILGIMCEQLRITARAKKEETRKRKEEAQKRRDIWDFWRSSTKFL